MKTESFKNITLNERAISNPSPLKLREPLEDKAEGVREAEVTESKGGIGPHMKSKRMK